MKNLTIRETAQWLLSRDNYTILTHRRPDGDTVGCAIALCRGLRKLGKQAAIYENPQFTPRYLPYLSGLMHSEIRGTVISVDIASDGLFPNGFAGAVELAVDHHGSNNGFAAEGFVDGTRAACGEIILELLREMGAEIDSQMADALYIAISTDTGCFRYSNTKAATLRAVADLMECGADTVSLNRMLFVVKSRARFRLEAYLTEGMELYADGKIGICTLLQADMDRMGVNEDDADSIAGFARDLEGVEIGALLRDLPDGKSKISLRTDNRLFNASEICKRLGGGGHNAAAGATVEGTIDDCRRALLNAIAEETGMQVDA